MKKILHISKFYYPYFGGIEDVVFSIVSELKDKYEQHIICFNHEKTGTIRTTNNGIEVIRVSAPVTIASQPISPSYYRILREEIKKFKPDIIHVHFPNPLIGICLLTMPIKAKLVIHWHSDIIGKNTLYRLYRHWEKRILERANAIIATSEQYIEQSEPLKPFVYKIHILPNIVNEEKLQLQTGDEIIIKSIQEQYGNKKIVLFIGRHVPYKGIDYLVKAAPFLPEDCVILIGGTGELTESLQQLAQPYGEKVQFLGRLQDREMRCYLITDKTKSLKTLSRPEKIFLHNTNLMYALGTNTEIGTVRETFFLNQLSEVVPVHYPAKGDFLVDNKYLFEVGGANKTFEQIKDIADSFLAIDNTETGYKNRIPLWIFGFLY